MNTYVILALLILLLAVAAGWMMAEIDKHWEDAEKDHERRRKEIERRKRALEDKGVTLPKSLKDNP